MRTAVILFFLMLLAAWVGAQAIQPRICWDSGHPTVYINSQTGLPEALPESTKR